MAEIIEYESDEEFYAAFVRVEGKRGVVLIFPDEHAVDLAKDIAKIIDGGQSEERG